MIFRFKTQNLRHLNDFQPVLIANETIILQRKAGVVPMPLLDPKNSRRIIQQTTERTGKNKRAYPIEDLYQF